MKIEKSAIAKTIVIFAVVFAASFIFNYLLVNAQLNDIFDLLFGNEEYIHWSSLFILSAVVFLIFFLAAFCSGECREEECGLPKHAATIFVAAILPALLLVLLKDEIVKLKIEKSVEKSEKRSVAVDEKECKVFDVFRRVCLEQEVDISIPYKAFTEGGVKRRYSKCSVFFTGHTKFDNEKNVLKVISCRPDNKNQAVRAKIEFEIAKKPRPKIICVGYKAKGVVKDHIIVEESDDDLCFAVEANITEKTERI